MTEQDTFDALRRPAVEIVDEQVLIAFNMPAPFNPILRDTYEIEIENNNDRALLFVILDRYHWDVKAYLKNSRIEFIGLSLAAD